MDICIVYLIRSGETDYYKIGCSNNPIKRLDELQPGNPEKLLLVNTRKCSNRREAYGVETATHSKFAKFRIHSEWFRLKGLQYFMAKEFMAEYSVPEINYTGNPIDTERNLEMFAMHKAGDSLAVIGRENGVSRQRVHQIISRMPGYVLSAWKGKEEAE